MAASSRMDSHMCRISLAQISTYQSRALLNPLLNNLKKGPSRGMESAFPPFSSPADRVGLRDRAQKAEMMMDMPMVTANCSNSLPVTPGSSSVGIKTQEITSAVLTMGPDTSFMAAMVAWRGFSPLEIWFFTASTTTMASSTTRPMASTSPIRQMVLMEKPNNGKAMKAPTIDTGTANAGISVPRQPWRKMKTTSTTRPRAITSVLTMSSIPARTASVESRETR